MTYTETQYYLVVRGRTWGGGDADHDYRITEEQANQTLTLADAKRHAGDFESLTSAEIQKVVMVTTDTLERELK